MSKNVMLIDGNALGNLANGLRPLKIGDQKVQAIYGFLRHLREYTALHLHYTPVVLWDGKSWRKNVYAEYKANREKNETPSQIKAQEGRKEYEQQRPYIKKALRLLGVPQAFAINMEADDLAAIFADRYVAQGKKVLLVTGDGDWLQLISEKTSMRDLHQHKIIRIKDFQEVTGVNTTAQFVEVKALAGDAGDNIKGVGGIGKKGAVEFINTYGSYTEFYNRAIFEKSIDMTKLPAKFRALAEDENKALKFKENLMLVDLRTNLRPRPNPLQIDKGTPDAEKFRKMCELLLFKTFLTDYEQWISVFPPFRAKIDA